MELAEAVGVANAADVAADDKCPFCHKKPKNHATKKPEEVNDKVTSVPKDLGVEVKKRAEGHHPYTTAAHHLISAMQCYAQLRRLVRMGNMAKYDINNPKNGIGLPTTHWTLKYEEGGQKTKYGDLDEPGGKRKVAFALMKELGAQWHVGHHAFDIKVSQKDYETWKEEGPDEKDEKDVPHETSYDVLIIAKLFGLLNNVPTDLCEDPKKDDKFKERMDKISDEIREKLDKFNGKNGATPADSSPLFVSLRAYEFSGVADMLDEDDPIDATSR
jgi:A nuclease family of the HNH/ENDO VII superfamily with conserved AHH